MSLQSISDLCLYNIPDPVFQDFRKVLNIVSYLNKPAVNMKSVDSDALCVLCISIKYNVFIIIIILNHSLFSPGAV